MHRKPTKNTRGPNTQERLFHGYVKQCSCCVCGKPGPSIVDHCYGSTAKQNKVLIGHWWVIPLCEDCDRIKTLGNTKRLIIMAGEQLKFLWASVEADYFSDCPEDVYHAIMEYREYMPEF